MAISLFLMEGSKLKFFILLLSDYCNGLLANVPTHIINRSQLVWNVARIQSNTRSNKHINSGFHVIKIRDGKLLLLPHIPCSSGELRQNCFPLVCPLRNISLGRVFHCQIEVIKTKEEEKTPSIYIKFSLFASAPSINKFIVGAYSSLCSVEFWSIYTWQSLSFGLLVYFPLWYSLKVLPLWWPI